MKLDPRKFYDFEAAKSDGWFISQAAGNVDGTKWRLERDDESMVFDGDPAAHAHVVRTALAGDANAIMALLFLGQFEPLELSIIEDYAAKVEVWDTDLKAPWAYEFGTLEQEKLCAIRSRVSGIWDHPSLIFFGPMKDLESDLLFIMDTCPEAISVYCEMNLERR